MEESQQESSIRMAAQLDHPKRVPSLSNASPSSSSPSSSRTLKRQDSHLHKKHSVLKITFCIIITIVVAFLIPTQAGMNVLLAEQLGNPLRSALVSFAMGSSFLSTFLCWDCRGTTIPTFERFINQLNSNKKEWLLMFNGILGVIYVTTVIYVSPIIGFALYFMCVIAGQMILSTLIDLYQTSKYYNEQKQKQKQKQKSNGHKSNTTKKTSKVEKEKKRMYFLTFFSIIIILAGVVMFQLDSLTSSNSNNKKNNNTRWEVTLLCSLIAFVIGLIDVLKSWINRRVKLYIGSPWLAASTNFINGTVVLAIIVLIDFLTDPANKSINFNKIDNSEWYMWFGGLTGAFWMTVITIIMPGYIGYVGTFICAIFGNFVMSMIYDTLGVFGVKSTQLTWNRIVGSICVFIAVILINVNKLIHSRQPDGTDKNEPNTTATGNEDDQLEATKIETTGILQTPNS